MTVSGSWRRSSSVQLRQQRKIVLDDAPETLFVSLWRRGSRGWHLSGEDRQMVSPEGPKDATALMVAAADGDKVAADRLYPIVFEQLRRAAQAQLANERAGHTLSATALVHEAYLKLAGPRQVPWAGRGHYYAAAAQAMRQILVDYARARAAHIRGGPEARRAAIELESLPDPNSERESSGFMILDDAISRLEDVDEKAAAVVRLRYFAGLSIADTALALDVSEPTVKRTWAFARGWLREAIESDRI